MSHRFDAETPDDLVRLWQESLLPAPDPGRVTRRVAKMALTRFDRAIFWRNVREYAGYILLLFLFGRQWIVGGDRIEAALVIAGASFGMGYLWWQHRRIVPADPSADARTFQAALLARIDDQIRLLSRIRYWYLLPLYVSVLWTTAHTWRESPIAAVVGWTVVTGAFVWIAWVNERLVVGHLKGERARVEALYEEG